MADLPVLDHTRLNYPSDDMKLGAFSPRIKQEHTGKLKTDLASMEFIMVDLYVVMDTERRIAEQAFARKLGKPDPYRDELYSSRDELVDALVDSYAEFGIASGPAQVKELVRGIEKQAIAQAEEYLGKGR